MTIKFRQYYITDDKRTVKAKVHYSLDNRIDGRKCVTLYAQEYGKTLQYFFSKEYENDSDMMTDYFEKGRVTIFEDHPIYAYAREQAEYYIKKNQERRERAIKRRS